MGSGTKQCLSKGRPVVQQSPEFQNIRGQIRVGTCSRLDDTVFLIFYSGSGLFRRPCSAVRAKACLRMQLFPAIITCLWRRWRRSGINFIDEAGAGTELFVALDISSVIICLKHPIISPAGDVLDFLRRMAGFRETSNSSMSEIMRVDRLIDIRSSLTFSEHIADSGTAQCTLFRIGMIIVTQNMPERCFRPGIEMVVIKVGPELSPTVKDRVTLIRCSFVIDRLRIGLVIGSIGIEIVDITDTELGCHRDTSTGINEKFDEGFISGVPRGFFEIFNVLLGKYLIFAHAINTLRRALDIAPKTIATVIRVVIEPSEEDTQCSAIPTYSRLGIHAVATLVFRYNELLEQPLHVAQIHIDERSICPIRGVSKGTQVSVQSGGGGDH